MVFRVCEKGTKGNNLISYGTIGWEKFGAIDPVNSGYGFYQDASSKEEIIFSKFQQPEPHQHFFL